MALKSPLGDVEIPDDKITFAHFILEKCEEYGEKIALVS